jgi:hypothetical protein
MSRRQPARLIGMSAHSNLGDYERGQRIPPGDIVPACERVLSVEPDHLQALRREALSERARRLCRLPETSPEPNCSRPLRSQLRRSESNRPDPGNPRTMNAVTHALSIAGSMTWEITWALVLGFLLSAIVQALVRKSTVARLLGDDSPRTLAIASALGAASSSCSYAAVALARSLFRKGANFTAAMAFEIASTNLVVELGVILALLMGWQFTVAEFVGGPVMIVVLAVLFRLLLRDRLLRAAHEQADRAVPGSMEGHAAMDMSVHSDAPFMRRLLSRDGLTSVAHVFVMEWAAILRDWPRSSSRRASGSWWPWYARTSRGPRSCSSTRLPATSTRPPNTGPRPRSENAPARSSSSRTGSARPGAPTECCCSTANAPTSARTRNSSHAAPSPSTPNW